MTQASFEDTHDRLTKLEIKNGTLVDAVKELTNSMNELVKNQSEFTMHTKQYHIDSERKEKQLAELKSEFKVHKEKANRNFNWGAGVGFVLSVILGFSSNYLMRGIVAVTTEINEINKRIQYLEYKIGDSKSNSGDYDYSKLLNDGYNNSKHGGFKKASCVNVSDKDDDGCGEKDDDEKDDDEKDDLPPNVHQIWLEN